MAVQAQNLTSHHTYDLCLPEAASHSLTSSGDLFKGCGFPIKTTYKKGNQHAEKTPPLKHSFGSGFSTTSTPENLGLLSSLNTGKRIFRGKSPTLPDFHKEKISNNFSFCIELRMVKSSRLVGIIVTIQNHTKTISKIRKEKERNQETVN